MQRLPSRVILGLYYESELSSLSSQEVSRLLKERQKLIQKYLLESPSLEDPRLWPDYAAVMQTILHKRLRSLTSTLLQNWPELLNCYPSMGKLYEAELIARDTLHSKNLSRRQRRARLATINKLGKDLRWLGRFEQFVHGTTIYGYPTN